MPRRVICPYCGALPGEFCRLEGREIEWHAARVARALEIEHEERVGRGATSGRRVHELKTWSDSFIAMAEGKKTHEVRPSDRPFAVADVLRLREFVPHETCVGTGRVWDNGDKTNCGCPAPHGEYTGRVLHVEVTYLTPGGKFGLPVDLCVMSVRRVAEETFADG